MNGSPLSLMDRLDLIATETDKGSSPPFLSANMLGTSYEKMHVPTASSSSELFSDNPTDCPRGYCPNLVIEGRDYGMSNNRTTETLFAERSCEVLSVVVV
jgi:hypothetical protein